MSFFHIPKAQHACIQVRAEEADISASTELNHDWSSSVYGELGEIISHNAPAPLVKYVTLLPMLMSN
jgi:hypothetical protein